jgi:hypothetical protein
VGAFDRSSFIGFDIVEKRRGVSLLERERRLRVAVLPEGHATQRQRQ